MPKVGIAVFVFSPTGQIILGKRKGSHGAGTWALPGGHLEENETFETCASRETVEETGLNIPESGIRFLTATNSIMVEEGKHYVTVFVGGVVSGEVDLRVMEPEKCEAWDWVSWEEVKAYSDDERVRKLFQPIRDLIKQRPGFEPWTVYQRG